MNTQEFLSTLYGLLDEGWLEITLIAPSELKKYPRTLVMWKEIPLTFSDPNFTKLHQLNEESGYGVYFGLASRREKKPGEWRINERTGEKRWCATPRGWNRDAKYITALWAETDSHNGENLDDARRRIEALRPSILVFSGGGWHGYWLLDVPVEITDENRNAIKRALKGLSIAVGGDPHVAELARIFRLPDTINTKIERAGARCEVVDFQPIYTPYQTLYDQYAPLVPERKQYSQPRSYDPASDDELEKALFSIPPTSISYDDWLRTLAGLTHSLGADKAEELGERWTGWCSESGEVGSKVASLDGDNGSAVATLGSVFHLAKQFGYQAPTREERSMKLRTTVNQNIQRIHEMNSSW